MLLLAKYNENNRVKVGEIDMECSVHGERRNAYRILMGKPE
jgi:hypothetical protein